MGNDLKYSRSFVTSYSLFITLQDTTAAMGATETCPGTQVCHEGGADTFCADLGLQVSGKHGVWRRGYGVLQNQHTYHRGPAHRDEHGDHRVLFILTFAPRPAARAESRMIGQGGSYSIRWDMWGFTLNDLGHATTRMAWPWAPLKALGLYRFPGSNWGWDFPAIVSMRIAIEDTGYTFDDLDSYIENGEPSWLPSSIRAKAADEVSEEGGWEDYLIACVDESRHILQKVNVITLALYLGLTVLLSFLQLASARRKNTKPKVFISSALARLFLTHGLIALSAYLALRYIANTPWAKDIDHGRQFTSAVGPTSDFLKREMSKSSLRPTLPRKNDAMFSIRYDGENYGSINRFMDYHPGNLRLDSIIGHFHGNMRALPTSVQECIVQTILGEMKQEDRRILVQTGDGGWTVMNPSESYHLITRELLKANDKLLSTLDAKISLMISKARYGELRSTTMAQKFSVAQLEQLRRKLFSLEGMGRSDLLLNQTTSSAIGKMSQFRIASIVELSDRNPRPQRDSTGGICLSCICDPDLCSPIDRQFLPSVGDVVEAQYQGKFNEYYKAKVIRVNNPLRGGYDVEYFDGDIDRGLTSRSVRRYVPPSINEVIEARVPDEEGEYEWELCAVTKIHDGDEYDVQFEDGKNGYSLPVTDIRHVLWEFEEGDDVFVENKGGIGVVTKELGDGTYDVRYDDGEEAYGVPQDLIHLIWRLDDGR